MNNKNKENLPLCACGCGEHVTNSENKYILYHQLRNIIHKENCMCVACRNKRGDFIEHKEDCKCVSCSAKRGIHIRSEHKKDCPCTFCLNKRAEKHPENCNCGQCKAKRGEYIGNNNNPMRNPEVAKKSGLSRRGKPHLWSQGENNCMKNPEIAEKVSKAKKGKTLQELGHKEDCNCPICKLSRKELSGENHPSYRHKISEESKKQIGKKNRPHAKKSWKNPEYIAKQMKSHKVMPNRYEKFVKKLLNKLFPGEWDFVGDGKLIINGRCPDYVHKTKPLLIEFFGDFWHSEEKTGLTNEEHEKERKEHFLKEGYNTLIIWGHELNEIELVVQRIIRFTNED